MEKVFLFFLILFSASANASVDLKSTERIHIPVDNVTPKITSEDVAKIIPLDLAQGDSEVKVFSRIADRGVTLWINSSIDKGTSVGRLAKATQDKLKADVIISGQAENKIDHKFTFKLEAFQALARMEYSGWLRAVLNYDMKSSTSDLMVKETVFENKDLVISHKKGSDQALSMVGLAWTW